MNRPPPLVAFERPRVHVPHPSAHATDVQEVRPDDRGTPMSGDPNQTIRERRAAASTRKGRDVWQAQRSWAASTAIGTPVRPRQCAISVTPSPRSRVGHGQASNRVRPSIRPSGRGRFSPRRGLQVPVHSRAGDAATTAASSEMVWSFASYICLATRSCCSVKSACAHRRAVEVIVVPVDNHDRAQFYASMEWRADRRGRE